MKKTAFVFYVVLSFNAFLFAQEDNLNHQMIILKTQSGKVLKIKGEITSQRMDSALIIVEEIYQEKTLFMQSFKTICTFPLKIDTFSFDTQEGLFIQYDPAYRYNNKFLFLWDDISHRFKEVKGFQKLGMVKHLVINHKVYHYSYIGCGCADNCWKSILFDIQDFKIQEKAFLSCNCEKLIEKIGTNEEQITTDCNAFNHPMKMKNIEKYWIERIKDGL
jgi:hypothetical protein